MQHGICIGDLAPAPLTTTPPGFADLNNIPHNIIMCAQGDIDNITNGVLRIKIIISISALLKNRRQRSWNRWRMLKVYFI